MEGWAVNNVTGERGYRGGDGVFYKSEDRYREIGSPTVENDDWRKREDIQQETLHYKDEGKVERLQKIVRRQRWLQRIMLCVTVCITLSMVGWLLCGRWLLAVNNAMWLFVSLMYWHQQTFFERVERLRAVGAMENERLAKCKTNK